MGIIRCPISGKLTYVEASKSKVKGQIGSSNCQAASSRVTSSITTLGVQREGGRRSKHEKAARAMARQRTQRALNDLQPGFLKRRRVGIQARANYEKHAADFELWAKSKAFDTGSWVGLDTALESYFEALFLDGCLPSEGRQTLYGVCFVREIDPKNKEFGRAARLALKGWERSCPEKVIDPVPYEAVILICDALIKMKTKVSLQAASCALLSYDAYLRPSEAIELENIHVVEPRHGYTDWAIIIRPQDSAKRPAKNSEYDDTVVLNTGDPRRKHVIKLIECMYARVKGKANARLFPSLTLSNYEAVLKQAAHNACIPFVVTPHQFRHGGPSVDFLLKLKDLRTIQRHGRWRSELSVRRYEKSGKLLRKINKLSSCQASMAKRLLGTLVSRINSAGIPGT